jgi:hypothetical protein
MKPVTINLSLHVNILRKVLLVTAIILGVAAFVFTAINVYGYIANRQTISEYQSRIEKLKKQAENKELKKLKKELNYFIPIIERDLFSLPLFLTEIEKNKPEKINIYEIAFSENLRVANFKGESIYVESVSAFLVQLEKSRYFSVNLIREVIKEDHSIMFELQVEWK